MLQLNCDSLGDSRRPRISPQSDRPNTSRAHVAITIAMYAAALSPPEIWPFARSKSVNTNSLQYGRAIISELTRLGDYRLKHEYQLSVHFCTFHKFFFLFLTLCSLGNPTKQRVGGYNSYIHAFVRFLSKTCKSIRATHVPSRETWPMDA